MTLQSLLDPVRDVRARGRGHRQLSAISWRASSSRSCSRSSIAGIGCLRGLQTRAGASAVGDAATRAVVSGIILLVIVDGVFAVLYFVLDI